jgi:serine/threonine protein kinase
MDAMVLEMHLRATPPDARDLLPSMSRSLAKVLATALQKDPNDRWQSAAAMRQALTASLGD